MKKLIALSLALVMCLSLCACGGGSKKAFEASKAAYDNIDIAYEITEQYGSDIYDAWQHGIYDDDKILEEGAAYLATEMHLSEDEIKDGVAYAIIDIASSDTWDSVSEENKNIFRESNTEVFKMMEDDLFSFCVEVVTAAYLLNGKADEAQTALEAAKMQMKELSEQYSDYEHYPNLKGYYTTTRSFFDFCQNPSGSFEQVKDTLNDYKNTARDYISDLDYIFEE